MGARAGALRRRSSELPSTVALPAVQASGASAQPGVAAPAPPAPLSPPELLQRTIKRQLDAAEAKERSAQIVRLVRIYVSLPSAGFDDERAELEGIVHKLDESGRALRLRFLFMDVRWAGEGPGGLTFRLERIAACRPWFVTMLGGMEWDAAPERRRHEAWEDGAWLDGWPEAGAQELEAWYGVLGAGGEDVARIRAFAFLRAGPCAPACAALRQRLAACPALRPRRRPRPRPPGEEGDQGALAADFDRPTRRRPAGPRRRPRPRGAARAGARRAARRGKSALLCRAARDAASAGCPVALVLAGGAAWGGAPAPLLRRALEAAREALEGAAPPPPLLLALDGLDEALRGGPPAAEELAAGLLQLAAAVSPPRPACCSPAGPTRWRPSSSSRGSSSTAAAASPLRGRRPSLRRPRRRPPAFLRAAAARLAACPTREAARGELARLRRLAALGSEAAPAPSPAPAAPPGPSGPGRPP
eukprot:tig00001003_g6277.t1